MKRTSTLKAGLMYGLTTLFLFFEMALQVSPSVMTTVLMHDLDLTALSLGLMSGCYFYSYALMQIPSGVLLDRFNPKYVISLAILICVGGCFLLAFSENMLEACLARLLMGLGSSFAFVSVLVITTDLFPAKYFAILTGVTQMLAALGAMSGQFPVHFLLGRLGWRNTLLIFALPGATNTRCIKDVRASFSGGD